MRPHQHEFHSLSEELRVRNRKTVRCMTLALLCILEASTLIGCAGQTQNIEPSVSHTESSSVEEVGGRLRNVVFEHETHEMYAQRNENQIYGVIYVPQNAGDKMPAVIFSHGFGGNYRVGVQYARAPAEQGIVAYCFDFCGGSPGSRSDGSTLEMSIFTEQADLEAVLSMIQRLPYAENLLDYS